MKGLIWKELPRGYFTNMKDVFALMNNKQKKYNWLITDYECNHYPSKIIQPDKKYLFIDGSSLTTVIEENDIQFIWGVFTGFKQEIELEEILHESLPYANENVALWNRDNVTIQNSLADIEIISWDSSLLLLLAKSNQMIDDLMKLSPKCKDLLDYNLK